MVEVCKRFPENANGLRLLTGSIYEDMCWV